jgi:hypothetical protein
MPSSKYLPRPTEYEVSLLQARLGISYEEAKEKIIDVGCGWSNMDPDELPSPDDQEANEND